MKRPWIFYVAKAAFCITAGLFLFGWVVMTLWNNLVPMLFGGPAIGLGQALGLFVLARLLFGFGVWRRAGGRRGEKQFSAMTPDERAKFRDAYAKRCGQWCRQTEPNEETTLAEKTPEPEREPQETL